MGAIQWTETGSLTQKKLRHLNIRELAVLESRNAGEIEIGHIPGKINPADMFTKEDRDVGHLQDLRGVVMYNCDPNADSNGGCQKRDCPTEEVQTKARRASEKSANMEKEVNRWQRMEESLWSRLVDRLSSALKGEI